VKEGLSWECDLISLLFSFRKITRLDVIEAYLYTNTGIEVCVDYNTGISETTKQVQWSTPNLNATSYSQITTAINCSSYNNNNDNISDRPWPSCDYHSCFVFGSFRVQISALVPAILTKVFPSFSQSHQANAGILPQIKTR
jgi:hypothetical protein